MLGIGYYFRARNHSREEFFLAGRRMGWIPIGLSIMVTVFSAINYVALPEEVFGYGLYVIVALPVFFLVAWPITRFWMPLFHAMRVTSAHEYLEYRFDVRVRILGGVIFILWRLFWMATALYAAGTIMGALIGLSPPGVILVCGLVGTVYTAVGGMRAVMWTDVAQFCVLFGGIVLGLVLAIGDGGISGILAVAREGGRLKPFLPFDTEFLSPSPFVRMTLWSGLIGVFVAFLARYGADQVVMQRYFSARSLHAAQRGLWFNAVVSVLSLSILAIFGLAVYAYAANSGGLEGYDWNTLSAVQRKAVARKQLALLIKSFPAGATGLIAAGLMAATMSSIDSGINACSAIYMTDFHERLFSCPAAKTDTSIWLSQALTLTIGLLSTGLALGLIPLVGQTNTLFMIVNKVVNGMGSPLLVLFVAGMFTRWANAPGVLIGGAIGVTASLFISLGVRDLSLQYYAVANLLATIFTCYVISKIAVWFGYTQDEKCLNWTWKTWNYKHSFESDV